MRWYHYVAYFFGGAFLANTLPHLGNGISGHPFQSPFASPPGEGLSSSTVNVLWGLFNLAVGYLLVCRVGTLRRSFVERWHTTSMSVVMTAPGVHAGSGSGPRTAHALSFVRGGGE
jgi:hypothetical protein